MFFGKKKKAEQEPIQFVEGSFFTPCGYFCEYGQTRTGLGVDVYSDRTKSHCMKQLRDFKGAFDNLEMLGVLIDSAMSD